MQGLRSWEERVRRPPSSGHPVRGPQAAFWWPLQESWWGGRPWTKAELRVQLVGGFGGQRSCLGRRGLQGGACHRCIPAQDSLNRAAAGVLWAGVELGGSGGQTGQVAAPLQGGAPALGGPHPSPLRSCPASAPTSRYRATGHSLLSNARRPLPRPVPPALPDPSRQPPGSSLTWDGLAGGETPGKQPPPAPGRCPREGVVT